MHLLGLNEPFASEDNTAYSMNRKRIPLSYDKASYNLLKIAAHFQNPCYVHILAANFAFQRREKQ